MRKNFIKIALFGALAITSAGFAGCSDYDDDIDGLRKEINELKSVSIADLSTQLQALKDANSSLQATSTSMQNAISEVQKSIEAYKSADEALQKAIAGKADQNALEEAVRILTDKNKELADKLAALSGLQVAIEGKADQAALDALNKSIENLKSQDADFANQLSALQVTSKTNLDTAKKELTDLIKQIEADLSGKISGLEQAKADLTVSIEALKGDITALNTRIDELKLVDVNDFNAVKAESAENVKLIGQVNTTLGQISGSIQAIEERVDVNKQDIGKLSGTIQTIQSDLNGKISKTDFSNLWKNEFAEFERGYKADTADVHKRLRKLEGYKLTDDEAYKTLKSQNDKMNTELYGDEKAGKEGAVKRIQELESQLRDLLEKGFGGAILNSDGSIDFEKTVTQKIQEVLDAEEGVLARLDALEGNVKDLQNEVNALLKRVQSLVFVPQYMAASGNSHEEFVPLYAIKNVFNMGEVTMKFRVSPAAEAKKLAQAGTQALINGMSIFSFIVEEDLKTRAAASEDEDMKIVTIEGNDDGIITIAAKPSYAKFVSGIENSGFFPLALRLSNTMTVSDGKVTPKEQEVNNITTEYFKVATYIMDQDLTKITVNKKNVGVPYTTEAAKSLSIAEGLEISADVNGKRLLSEYGYGQRLKVYGVYVNGILKEINSRNAAVVAAWKKEVLDNHFVLDPDKGTIAVVAPNSPTFKGSSITLCLAEENFGFQDNGIPYKTFDVTYEITVAKEAKDIDYGMMGKGIWNLDNTAKTFTVPMNREIKFKDVVVNATPENIKEAIQHATRVTYEVNGEKVTDFNKYPKFDLMFAANATDEKAIIAFPAGAKWEKYELVTKYETDLYGTINVKAELQLDYDKDAFLIHEPVRWINDGVYFLEYAKPVIGTKFIIEHDFWTGYKPLTDAQVNAGVKYSFEKKDIDDPNTFFNENSWIAGVRVIDTKTAGLSTNNIIFDYRVDNLDLVTVIAKAWVGNNVAHAQEFNLKMEWPVKGQFEKINEPLTFTKANIIANATFNWKNKVNLKDRYERLIIKEGEFVTENGKSYATTYFGNNKLSFKFGGSRLATVSTNPDPDNYPLKLGKDLEVDTSTGAIKVKDQVNIVEPVIVTIEYQIENTYGLTKGTQEITLEATK